jgi:hypothetical protein
MSSYFNNKGKSNKKIYKHPHPQEIVGSPSTSKRFVIKLQGREFSQIQPSQRSEGAAL